MKRITVFILLMTPLTVMAATTDYNALGYREYKTNNIEKALVLFEKATVKQPKNPFGYYNLACTLSIMRERGLVCEYHAYIPRIIELLQTAIALDFRRQYRAMVDEDLTAVHPTAYFRFLQGFTYDTDSDLALFLSKVNWYGLRYGMTGVPGQMVFRYERDNYGTFDYDMGGYMDFTENIDEDTDLVYVSRGRGAGTYRVEDGKIYVDYTEQDGVDKNAVLSFEYTGKSAVLSGGEAERRFLYYDFPPECED